MTPAREQKLSRLLIACARTHRNADGNPEATEIGASVARRIILHLEEAWAMPEHEIERRIANVSSGVVR